jgi:hypothetical protein
MKLMLPTKQTVPINIANQQQIVQQTVPVSQATTTTVVIIPPIPVLPSKIKNIAVPPLDMINVNVKFSLRLPPECAIYVRENFDNYNNFIRALVQSYMDERIDRDKVLYYDR